MGGSFCEPLFSGEQRASGLGIKGIAGRGAWLAHLLAASRDGGAAGFGGKAASSEASPT